MQSRPLWKGSNSEVAQPSWHYTSDKATSNARDVGSWKTKFASLWDSSHEEWRDYHCKTTARWLPKNWKRLGLQGHQGGQSLFLHSDGLPIAGVRCIVLLRVKDVLHVPDKILKGGNAPSFMHSVTLILLRLRTFVQEAPCLLLLCASARCKSRFQHTHIKKRRRMHSSTACSY